MTWISVTCAEMSLTHLLEGLTSKSCCKTQICILNLYILAIYHLSCISDLLSSSSAAEVVLALRNPWGTGPGEHQQLLLIPWVLLIPAGSKLPCFSG